MKSDPIMIVQIAGPEIRLGTASAFHLAAREITEYTGGSSLGGNLSTLWSFFDGEQRFLTAERAAAVAREAAECQRLFGEHLTKRANRLLAKLAKLSAPVK